MRGKMQKLHIMFEIIDSNGKMQKLHIIFEIMESNGRENAEITHYIRNN